MTADEKYEAVVNCDKACDGRFFYAVKTTGVFCRPSCASRVPCSRNVRYFDTAAQAAANGFRPCKRCRPDLVVYAPEREAAQAAKRLLDDAFAQGGAQHVPPDALGFSPHRLAEVFKDEYGMTMAKYSRSLRVNEAKRLLTATDDDMLSVMHRAGFASASTFYRVFKQHAGVSPLEYRKAVKGESR